jgi:hypothetical protein
MAQFRWKENTPMIRSLLSVIAGFVGMAILVMIATGLAVKFMLHASDMQSVMKLKPTPAYLAVNLAYSAIFAVFGGLITANIAGRAPVVHALALAGLMLVMSVVSFFQSAQTRQPKWYGLTLMVLVPAGAVLGGYLQTLRQSH